MHESNPVNHLAVKPTAILLATYNGAKYIREFLDSLRAQSYADFCIYVRDDGSTDGTLSIIEEYASRLKIRVLPSVERLGPAKGFFKIMEEASPDHLYYLLADQDDYWYADKVERVVRALRGHEDEVLFYCSRLEYVDEHLQHLALSPIPRLLSLENSLVENVAVGCTVGFTRRMRSDVLAKRPEDFIMHDWWLYIYATAFGTVVYDAKPSIKYRQHGNNTIGVATSFVEDFKRRWKRFRKQEGGVYRLSRQTKDFLDCYGVNLQPQQRKLLETLTKNRDGLMHRLRLAIAPPVARQKRTDTLILRLIFLIGRY